MNKKASLLAVFLTVFIDLMGFGILIPILPNFANRILGIDEFAIGVLMAIFSLVQFLFNKVLGSISDRYGRRPVILTTLLITTGSYVLFSFSTTFLMLFISRLLAGFGGSNIAVAQAYIADITDDKNRSRGMGLIGAAFGLGFVFGPVIGGFLSKFGYDIAGFGAAGFSFLAFIFAFIFLKESHTERDTSIKINMRLLDYSLIKRVMQAPVLGLLISIFFIIVFSMANIYGTFALIGEKKYEFGDLKIGLLFGIFGLVGAVVQGGLIKRLSDNFGAKRLVYAGLVLMMIGLSFIPYGVNFTGVAIAGGLLSFGTGILQPTVLSMISNTIDRRQQGEILGLNQSLASLARVLGPLWGGFSFEYLGYEIPFITGALFTFFTLIVALKYLRKLVIEGQRYV
ncbi:MAG: tetracycline resistance MFS efflux pump [Melioribacteraceae bacterium]|nr:MAG: tetracycline resistance MFS efflux pump [Melioribacteraceae bacterium]